jgi:proteasome lid subunit RPN8/RPN11
LDIGVSEQRAILTTAKKLSVREAAFRSMIRFLETCLPIEGVGLISVVRTEMGLVGDHFYGGQNIDASATRYTMDPADVSTALRDMEQRGSWLGAIVHSHPRTSPEPSRADLDEARIPGVLHLIVGFEPILDVRAWRLVFDERGVARRAVGVEFAICADPPGRPSENI